jgi:phospholipid/cholesterol/gamma-HCH transport system substrate-binding protein
MKRFNLEIAVGIFMVVGFVSFAYLAVRLGDVRIFEDPTYAVAARFGSISGLREGAVVEIAGVQVGRVERITLDPRSYDAVVQMTLDPQAKLPTDSIASIRTTGLIGERYINISPGGDFDYIEPGGEIVETESAVSIEELISRYIFGSGGGAP